jgi:muramoyltetrapeptide carboxypeptidase LdcA involved in peptidoglycan recycling
MIAELDKMNIKTKVSPFIYRTNSVTAGTARERGEALMNLFTDSRIEAVFDISGGDTANEILEHLDYKIIEENYKPFFGYSDLTTVLNAVYTKTGRETYLYQLKNLIYEKEGIQRERLKALVDGNSRELFSFQYSFLRGESMEGGVIGGNIRCFLKLSGTPYIPDFEGKILFLESLSGRVSQMITFISQLKQIGALNKIKGILLGTFTEMEREQLKPAMEELILDYTRELNLPIAKTVEIGHGNLSKGLIIGRSIYIHKNSNIFIYNREKK